MNGDEYNRSRTTKHRDASPRNRAKTKKGSFSVVYNIGNFLRPVKGKVDIKFLVIVIALLLYGIIMLYSASSSRAYAMEKDSFFFLKRQLGGMAVGGIGMYICSRIDYHNYAGKMALYLYGVCLIALVLVIAGFGRTVNGATRWIFGIQPSEIAKLALIVIISCNIGSPLGQSNIKSFLYGTLPYIILLGIYCILISKQPHFSCIVLLVATSVVIMFIAGVPIKNFIYLGLVASPFLALFMWSASYRVERITTFFNSSNADVQNEAYQISQSLYAIGSGGIFGVGLGQSRQKFQLLPEPQNDFIFSVICEELGLIGAILLIVLFAALIFQGLKIAAKAPDLYGTLLVAGIVTIIGLQVLINIAVVTGSIPVTGMPLPFFSYGGTAMMITMAEMGIVLNVSKQSKLPL